MFMTLADKSWADVADRAVTGLVLFAVFAVWIWFMSRQEK